MVQTAHTDLAAYHRTQWEQTVKVFGERLLSLPGTSSTPLLL